MTGYQLHDTETEELLGSVVITKKSPADGEDIVSEAWEEFNKLEETESDHTNVDEFVKWFNEGYVTQIERLYLEFVQL